MNVTSLADRKDQIAIVVADGLGGKGGIEKIMSYLTRTLANDHPDLPFYIQQTRYGDAQLVRHATTPLALAQFAARCLSGKVSLAHINVAPRGSTWRKLLFARAAQRAGVPVLLHLHGSGYDEFYAAHSTSAQNRIREFFRSANHVVVLGDHWYEFARDKLGVAEDRLSIVVNGTPDPQSIADPQSAEPAIVFFGQVSERKGIDILLPALGKVAAKGLPFRVRIGGNGDLDHWKSVAREQGLAERAEFLGWVGEDTVDAEMRRADIFVLPSRAENQPVAILEAMARGLPVVSTSIGAIPETVGNEECGLVVAPADVEALAEALERLVRDPALRLAMGRKGRAKWEANYSIRSSANAFADIYRQIV
ncbi:glycosyltransferase family 4 protein [Qipengyuania sphaerica]|uniref:glycosyltransferase family 4 protein n=1 Tax=Qipengyuania sphaerica TaxID=2867243 RepID=UPI001C86FBA1|nr:glycosyltransferase family 4 protein [Qipengyuania sphaerica]MBX7540815.1 glycosyltransferase family 4 protein [Qipengyuania sphaerica]